MPRYIIERTFPDGIEIPTTSAGARAMADVVDCNQTENVGWVTSFVSTDKTRTFCVYDGPDPDAIRRAATANGLPVDGITEVRVLDPYFYVGSEQ
jgi:hypothetical protein